MKFLFRQKNAKSPINLVIPARLERAAYCLEGLCSPRAKTYSISSVFFRHFPREFVFSWDAAGTKSFSPHSRPVAYLKSLAQLSTFIIENLKEGIALKWFKHYVGMSDDPKMQQLEGAVGPDGYRFYLKILEYCAKQYDGESDDFLFVINWETAQQILRMKRKQIQNQLRITSELDFWKADPKENWIEIRFPKLIEIRHKDALSSKIRRDSGGPEAGPRIRDKIKNNTCTQEWFRAGLSALAKKYTETFSGTTIGNKAEARLAEQVRTPEDILAISAAVDHYRDFLKSLSWDRQPKTSLETFLGTKRSGYFWTSYQVPVISPKLASAGDICGVARV